MGWFDPHVCGEENHRFEARYDSEPVADIRINATMSTLSKIGELALKRTYVADVCVRCGMTVRRSVIADIFEEFDPAFKPEDASGR